MKDYYDVLEVSPHACSEVIDAAHKALVLLFHPDKVGSNERIKELNNAHSTLKNNRAEYDRERLRNYGKIIGDYRILEQIAEGGFGITYKGEHVTLKVPVCIKHSSIVSPQNEEILKEEARAIWDLRHYAIPAIRNIIKLDDGSLALIMSYIEGPTLSEVVDKNKGLDPENVCWITERVLNALRYLHFHGVVHGDIKPGNIIIQPDKHMASLVDYGLSMIRPSHDSSSKGFTPFFASPEQERKMALLPESDLFSLGMTMIFALGGDVKKKKVPGHVPDILCNFIKKLIVYDVLARPKWGNNDLIVELQRVRQNAFKRTCSFGKKIPGF
jgi:serine/threonine protein kinase